MERRISVVSLLLLGAVTISTRSIHPAFEATERLTECLRNNPFVLMVLQRCYEEKLAMYPIPENLNDVEAIANRFCVVINPKTCLSNHVDLLQRCFTEEEHSELRSALDMVNDGYQYACDDDGANIKEFLKNDGIDCFQALVVQRKKIVEIVQCVHRITEDGLAELDEAGDDVAKQEIVTCRVVDKQKDCMVSRLNCDNEKPREFIEGLVRAILRKMDCWEYYVASSGGNNTKHFAVTRDVDVVTKNVDVVTQNVVAVTKNVVAVTQNVVAVTKNVDAVTQDEAVVASGSDNHSADMWLYSISIAVFVFMLSY